MDPVIITSYTNPDLDGVACSYAYSELLNKLGKNTVAMVSGTPHHEALWVLDLLKLKTKKLKVNTNSKIILVDTSYVEAIDPSINPDQVVEIVDHRKNSNPELFPNSKTQIEFVGAAATLIAEKFEENDIKPTRESCYLLAGAIASNTLNFKAGVTTDRDRDMFSWLLVEGKVEKDFVHNMLSAKSDLSDKKMKDMILSDLSNTLNIGEIKIAIGQLEIVGVDKLYKQRFAEILEALKKIKHEMNADYIFLSSIDLEDGFNGFAVTNDEERDLIKQVLGGHENGKYLRREGVILRKELIPSLIEHFQK